VTVFQSIKKGLIPARLSVDDVYALTAAGVLAENERMELIDGEVVPMAAAKANWHSMMEARLNRGIVRGLPDQLRLYPAPSITLSPGTLLEPDLVVLPKGSLIREMRGPDLLLVVEVADSSLSYDCRVKAPIYASYGVREYWVADAVRQTVRVHRAPTRSGYDDVEEFDPDVTITPVTIPELTIRLADLD
jgi:Uma2 family endonuclease